MEEKYLLLSLEDSRAKKISEILGNKTCKKIIDYLGDRREASEQEISKDLEIPMNTAEYNLKKLIKSGIVKKTGNFFWSVKGRKIKMYKLANKHIVISPGRKRPNLEILKTLLPVLVVVAFVAILVSVMISDDSVILNSNGELNQFSSQEELNGFIEANLGVQQTSSSGFWDSFGRVMKGGADMAVMETASFADSGSQVTGSGASDFSTTNIQVEGVDEADIVKNDGKYIYVVSGGKVKIIDAYPAEDMNILSEINESAQQIFIKGDKLILLRSGYGSNNGGAEEMIVKDIACYGLRCGGYGASMTIVSVYDISDKENPLLENEFEAEGNYVNSRMIGDYVYAISSKYVSQDNPQPPIYRMNGIEEKVLAEEVYYWDYYDSSYVFTGIMAIDVESGEFSKEVFLTGSSKTIFVSQNNIYLTGQKSFNHNVYVEDMLEEVYEPLFDSMNKKDEFKDILDSEDSDYEKLGKLQKIVREYSSSLSGEEKSDFDKELMERLNDYEVKIQKEREKTIIHKINIDKNEINYEGVGDVPGRVLNQFSMDEYNGYFRIATTTGQWGETSLNNVYILDEDLEIVGKVEDLAEGEKIFSARFMGNRCYLVTFESIDPLFVIDLSDVENPAVLGYLKIPGFSDYLHPYDENHIIGIGKDVDASIDADKIHSSHAIYYTAVQGVKVSLFDVSDVENPIEVDNWIVGERGSESEASYDHKSVLFDKEKGILVLPVSVSELEESSVDSSYQRSSTVWEGAYVLDISLNGISERGRITHNDNLTENEYGYINFLWENKIKRSLYMDNVLYTISEAKIKANNLIDITEINELDLGYKDDYNHPVVYGGGALMEVEAIDAEMVL